jgi:hypothetical protein
LDKNTTLFFVIKRDAHRGTAERLRVAWLPVFAIGFESVVMSHRPHRAVPVLALAV